MEQCSNCELYYQNLTESNGKYCSNCLNTLRADQNFRNMILRNGVSSYALEYVPWLKDQRSNTKPVPRLLDYTKEEYVISKILSTYSVLEDSLIRLLKPYSEAYLEAYMHMKNLREIYIYSRGKWKCVSYIPPIHKNSKTIHYPLFYKKEGLKSEEDYITDRVYTYEEVKKELP